MRRRDVVMAMAGGNIYTTEVDSGKRAQKFVLKSR
jgi:hypothetical protein